MGPTSLRYGPSDDYELLLAVDPIKRTECESIASALGVPMSIAGRFTNDVGKVMRVVGGAKRQELEVPGFDHFRR